MQNKVPKIDQNTKLTIQPHRLTEKIISTRWYVDSRFHNQQQLIFHSMKNLPL